MRVVVDTNVLVSAILKDRNPEQVVLYIASQPDFEWIVSPEILTEYKKRRSSTRQIRASR